MIRKKSFDLLKDPVKPLIFKLALPVMMSGFLRTSYSFIDMIFASRLGGVQVASVAFVAPLFIMIQALGVGLSTGGVSVIARFLGEGDSKKASAYASQLRYIILLIALIISVIGLFFSDSFLRSLGVSGDLLQQSAVYTQIRFFSIPFSLLIQLYMTFYKSQGKMTITTKLAFFGVLGNTLLNWLFISVLNQGIGGLAYATLLTMILQTIAIVWDYHRGDHSFNLLWRAEKTLLNFKIWKKLFKVGLPLSFSHGSSQFGFLLINTFIVPYGYQVVAAFAIGNQVNSLFFAPTSGVGQALIPLIAQNWGKKSLNRIKEAINTGMVFALLFGIFGAIVIQFIILPLGAFLAKGDEVIISHVINYIRLMGWTLIAWSVFQSLSGIFNGFQKTNVTMSISILRLWGLRIPGLLMFRYLLPAFAEYGVWYTMFFSNVITALMALLLYFLYIPKKIFRSMEISESELL